MKEINLSALMLEHMAKIMTTKNGKRGMAYEYLLKRAFKHFDIELKKKNQWHYEKSHVY